MRDGQRRVPQSDEVMGAHVDLGDHVEYDVERVEFRARARYFEERELDEFGYSNNQTGFDEEKKESAVGAVVVQAVEVLVEGA